ncbi:MAG: LamG-like jellyroll fold domain-containing protein, partial [archaeon]
MKKKVSGNNKNRAKVSSSDSGRFWILTIVILLILAVIGFFVFNELTGRVITTQSDGVTVINFNSSYSNVTRGIIIDSSGNGHNGSLQGLLPVSLSTGLFNNGLYFVAGDINTNPDSSWVDTNVSMNSVGLNSTIYYWFNLSPDYANYSNQLNGWMFSSHAAMQDSHTLDANLYTTSDRWCIGLHGLSGDNFAELMTGCSVSNLYGSWHQVAFVSQSGNHKLYIDGNLTSDFTGNSITDTNNIALNSISAYNEGRGINGSYDEFAVWNRTLNSSEISDLYNSGNAKQVANNNSGLVLLYHLDEISNMTITQQELAPTCYNIDQPGYYV